MGLSNPHGKKIRCPHATLYSTPESWYKVTMKRGFLRLLLLMVLAVTMPMKGIASVTMLGCLTHSDAIAHVHGAQDHSHAGHSGHEQKKATEVSVEHQDVSVPSGSKVDQEVKCGSCAPCCAGAALTTVRAAGVAERPRLADFPASATLHPSRRTTRLDRPPRSPAA